MGSQNKIAHITVGICDDEAYIHDEVTELMLDYAEKNDMSVQLLHYYVAKELLEAKEEMELLLLDIEMSQMDGIEAAYRLRNRGMNYKIVMLSAREDRYRDAFKIGAFRFVPKPIEKRELYKAVDDVCEHLVGLKKVTVFRNNVAYQIIQRDIAYIEANRSSTIVYTTQFEYRSENSLTMWSELLDERVFFRCHKSYIVNMGKIEDINQNTIFMVTGEKVNVSRRMKTALLNAYMVYDVSHRY